MSTPLLEMRAVSCVVRRGVRDVELLRDVTLRVGAGEFVGVIGPARAGKSMLLQLATGAVRPDRGSVHVDGRDLASLSAREHARLLRHTVGHAAAPQARAGYRFEVLEHVALQLRSRGVTARASETTAWEWLDRVGATECAHLRLGELSESESQRVALAAAMVRGPRLLLADALTDTLDADERREMLTLLCTFADEGVGVLAVGGDPSSVMGASRIGHLNEGRLMLPGEGHEATVVPLPERRSG